MWRCNAREGTIYMVFIGFYIVRATTKNLLFFAPGLYLLSGILKRFCVFRFLSRHLK